MQGLGVFITVVGYALIYTAYEQGFGDGGAFLYWLTGNTNLGPPPSGKGGNKGNGKDLQQNPSQTKDKNVADAPGQTVIIRH